MLRKQVTEVTREGVIEKARQSVESGVMETKRVENFWKGRSCKSCQVYRDKGTCAPLD